MRIPRFQTAGGNFVQPMERGKIQMINDIVCFYFFFAFFVREQYLIGWAVLVTVPIMLAIGLALNPPNRKV